MTPERLAEIRRYMASCPDCRPGAYDRMSECATALLAEVDRQRQALTAIAGAFNCDEHVDDLQTLTQLLIGNAGALGLFQTETPTVDDAMVERAAKGLAEDDDEAWRYHSDATRQWYLRHARRALTAALGEAEHATA